MALVYLDSAATSLWRPMCVAEAVSRSVILHAGYGRTRSGASDAAAGEIFSCRERLARMFNVSDPGNIVFCMNATHALNTAIFGLYSKGRPCVISGYEHNAVRRPICELAKRGETELTVAQSRMFDREDCLRSFKNAISEKRPGLVVCSAVGNVFGNILPVEEIGQMCRESGAAFVVDASQAAGVIELDAEKIGADALCMPGHKGLLGPTGTGVMILGKKSPVPFVFGGTGVESESEGQPDLPPERYESGTVNVCGICGLGAAVKYLEENGKALHEKKRCLCREFWEELVSRGFKVFGPEENCETCMFSFDPGFDSEIAAEMLSNRGIVVRGGLHCSPLAHISAGTFERGTVRISPQANLGRKTARKTARYIAEVLSGGR